MKTISDFPDARSLGEPLLAYVLNISANEIRDAQHFDQNHLTVLEAMDKAVKDIKVGRLSKQGLEWVDVMNLLNVRLQNGSYAFSGWRSILSGDVHTSDWSDDPVMAALSKMCEITFPCTLLPRTGFRDGLTDMSLFPHFYGTQIIDDFCSSVLANTTLRKLFRDPNETDPIKCGGTYYSLFGQGGGLQLATLHSQLLSSAYVHMLIHGEMNSLAFEQSAKKALDTLRNAIEGREAKVPMVHIFDGFGVPDDFEVKFKGGVVKPINRMLFDQLPGYCKPSIAGGSGDILGFAFIKDVDYKIVIKNDEERFTGKLPIELSDGLSEDVTNPIFLMSALAIERGASSSGDGSVGRIAPVPLGNYYCSWTGERGSRRNPIMLEKDETQKISEWAAILEDSDTTKIGLAVRRLLTAVSGRSNPTDSLVDAVIGLENLFGERSEIALSISLSVARLLADSAVERETIFEETKKIYDTRSKVVHGRDTKVNVVDMRDRAIKLLARCIRKMLENRPDLIPLDARDRVKELALS